MKKNFVNVIGAGLAGSEAALNLANNKIHVNLFDMKPNKFSPAHTSADFAELVCSNSLKSEDPLSAGGLLKEEMKILNSPLLEIAQKCKVPAGGALAVDREKFSAMVTEQIKSNEYITVVPLEVEELNWSEPTIIATGPLTSEKFYDSLMEVVGNKNCYFYDAIAPIIETSSIDFSHAFWGNRYGKGSEEGDYINCTLNKTEYELFHHELVSAERAKLKEFEKIKVFEGCMPIELLAERGFESLRFGPMKPVGLFDKDKNERPYAVLQLRKEDENSNSVNMVGFQTNLLYAEQKRVFGLIPALKNAEFLRYGSMHRNSYVNAPILLNEFSEMKEHNKIFIAGQLSGVEGYMESIASGLFVSYQMLRTLDRKPFIKLTNKTMIGALIQHISLFSGVNFVPMNANYGIIGCEKQFKDKSEKKQFILETSLKEINEFKEEILNGRII